MLQPVLHLCMTHLSSSLRAAAHEESRNGAVELLHCELCLCSMICMLTSTF